MLRRALQHDSRTATARCPRTAVDERDNLLSWASEPHPVLTSQMVPVWYAPAPKPFGAAGDDPRVGTFQKYGRRCCGLNPAMVRSGSATMAASKCGRHPYAAPPLGDPGSGRPNPPEWVDRGRRRHNLSVRLACAGHPHARFRRRRARTVEPEHLAPRTPSLVTENREGAAARAPILGRSQPPITAVQRRRSW